MKTRLIKLIPLAVGWITFQLCVGMKYVDPWNIDLISSGINVDPYAGYVAWLFYRNSPWGFPLGANPNYGLEVASSLVYSDSIPLMAIPMKLLARFTNAEIQYFGIWLLLCFLCQSKISWDLIGAYTRSIFFRTITSILFSTLPIFLWRIQSHFSLAGQFLVVYAIKLSFDSKGMRLRRGNWILLLSVSALVHPYFLAICGFMFLVRLIQEYVNKWISLKNALITGASCLFIVTVVATLVAGYNVKASNSMIGTSVEYGTYRFNWLSPLAPNGWSEVLSKLRLPNTNFETFSYLGMGVYLLIATAALIFVKKGTAFERVRNYRVILIGLIAMTLLAGTNRVAVGKWELLLPIPEQVKQLLSVFSASARFAWPVLYVLVFLSLLVLVRLHSTIIVSAILLVGTTAQLIDINKGILDIRFRLNESNYSANFTSLDESTWEALREKYNYIRVPLKGRESFGFPTLTLIANRFGFETNSVYFGRIDKENESRSNHLYMNAVNWGVFEPKTIYVINEEDIIDNLAEKLSIRGKLILVDGYLLLTP